MASHEPFFLRTASVPRANPLHPLETSLLTVTAVHLCFLPWALGGMHAWSQIVSLALAITGFVLALVPRETHGSSSEFGFFAGWNRILKFPVFWSGLAVVGYVTVQGVNPAWRFVSNPTSWWLIPLDHIGWLPSGIAGPFARSNAWRALTIYGSCWLMTCSVWGGVTRRQSYRILFTVLVTNGFLLAGLGILQQLLPTKRIFWTYTPSVDSFISSFIYRNHAGCYFNLLTALAVGLAWWHFDRERRRLERRGRSVIFTFLAVFTAIMVLFSYSRMAVLILLLSTAAIAAALTTKLFQRREGIRDRIHFLPPAIAVMAFIVIGILTLRTDKLWGRFVGLVHDPVASVSDRAVVREAATSMLKDRWLLGWGAGGFRYAFPLYAQKYPSIYYSGQGEVRYWEHAHDDLLEFPVELGTVGMVPLAFAFGFYSWKLLSQRFWTNGISLCAVLGCTLALLHSGVDFVFQNPAILLTWSAMLVGSLRWAELDPLPGRRLSPAVQSPPENKPQKYRLSG